MGTTRIVIGDLGGGRFGMKTSLPGVDALTADDNDARFFSFCSEWPNLVRVGASGYVSMNGRAGSVQNVQVAHNMGFVPFCEIRPMQNQQNTIYNEFAVDDFDNSHSWNRLKSTNNGSTLTISMYPWVGRQSDGSGGIIRKQEGFNPEYVAWIAYRDPPAS